MVASFDGDAAAERGGELADELSQIHHLTSYVHDRTFDHSDDKRPGRGLDHYGAPLRTRYQQEQAHEFAVLVGDFPSIDDPEAQKTLERIKTVALRSARRRGTPDRRWTKSASFRAR